MQLVQTGPQQHNLDLVRVHGACNGPWKHPTFNVNVE